MMVRAELEYEVDVKNIEYCAVRFRGNDSNQYKNEWDSIRHEKYYQNREKIVKYRRLIELVETEMSNAREELTSIGRYDMSSEKQKSLLRIIAKGNELLTLFDQRIEECKKDFFYSPTELYNKANKFLVAHEFNKIGQQEDNIDIWVKE